MFQTFRLINTDILTLCFVIYAIIKVLFFKNSFLWEVRSREGKHGGAVLTARGVLHRICQYYTQIKNIKIK